LQQLSEEHSGEISSVENALESAEQAEQDPQVKKEAKERAEALRQAFENLRTMRPENRSRSKRRRWLASTAAPWPRASRGWR